VREQGLRDAGIQGGREAGNGVTTSGQWTVVRGQGTAGDWELGTGNGGSYHYSGRSDIPVANTQGTGSRELGIGDWGQGTTVGAISAVIAILAAVPVVAVVAAVAVFAAVAECGGSSHYERPDI